MKNNNGMMTTKNYLDAVVTRHKITSFADLAALLKISRQAVHKKMKIGGGMSPLVAVRVAQLLDLPILEVIAATQHEEAKNDEEKEIWAEIYKAAQS